MRNLSLIHIFQRKLIKGGCFIDVKSCFDAAGLARAGIKVWRL